MMSAAERAASWTSDFSRGTKANAIDSAPKPASSTIRSGSSDEAWPQTLNGESRPAWLAIVRS
jgi:hypothetical protein